MEYFITDGVSNFGPFTQDQLREKNITPATKIWYSGLAGWTPAGEIPELAALLSSTPPPVSPPPPQFSPPGINFAQNKPPKT